eukprot:Phypoly_transcript_21752.p1 GENE.Phypoly_transcript_21752~~Phypoly_transcript_21752.p1  ORF type:complete len:103 (+),score=3.84 Phypoly_transcript_21752:130-438(+)
MGNTPSGYANPLYLYPFFGPESVWLIWTFKCSYQCSVEHLLANGAVVLLQISTPKGRGRRNANNNMNSMLRCQGNNCRSIANSPNASLFEQVPKKSRHWTHT